MGLIFKKGGHYSKNCSVFHCSTNYSYFCPIKFKKHKIMKKLSMILLLLLSMTMGSYRVFAQSVTVTLIPGYNWISIPSTDTLDFATALGSFTPAEGDVIKSQWSNAVYRNGHWVGQISQFYPGYGYMYKSNRTMPVMLTFNVQQPAPQVIVTTAEPSDLNMEDCTYEKIFHD